MRILAACAVFASFSFTLAAGPAELHRTEDGSPGCRLAVRGADGSSHVRRSRFVALRVEKGDAPSALVAPGAFTAEWSGSIVVPLRDRYTFAFEGVGKAKLEIGGKTVFEVAHDLRRVTVAPKKTRLKKGANPFRLTFTSRADGSGSCRLLWEGFGIARELVPPSVLVHEDEDKEVVSGEAVARGRAFVATRQCLTCHEDANSVKGGMTELRRRGRSLDGVGSRFREDWLARWLENPKKLRPTARMPRMLGDEARGHAKDLTAWLVTLRDPDTERAKVSKGDVTNGGALFATLGCIACHTRPDRAIDPESDRIPLTYVRGKWKTRAALAAFLEKPEAHDRWIRMPNFAFSSEELADMSAFLWEKSNRVMARQGDEERGDAKRGRALAEALGCRSCHTIEGLTPQKAKPWAEMTPEAVLGRGCASGKGKGPRYELTDREMGDLLSFVGQPDHAASFAHTSPADFAERQISDLRCTSCHRYDGRIDEQSRLQSEVDDLALPAAADEVDQIRPALTWLGEKLRSEWTQKFIGGDVKESPRPWLHARMPHFRSRARFLADGLAAMHGLDRTRKSEIAKPVPKLAAIGSRIVGKKGHSCTTCHAVGQAGATMVFESPGINLAHSAERLRADFYLRWMLDPQRFDKTTKMTKFADEKARTQLEEFDGDARAQFEAVWQYLLEGAKIRPPDETDR